MNRKIDERIKEEYEAEIKGKFKIYLGNKLYAKGKNMWTRYFASSLVEFVILSTSPLLSSSGEYYGATNMRTRGLSGGGAKAGNDTTTPTTPDMTDLANKIDISPSTSRRVILKSSDYKEYKAKFENSWNPGVIPPQTIGEFGIYFSLTDDSWESPYNNPSFGSFLGGVFDGYSWPLLQRGSRLGARIASADGAFDPIDYTSEEALILEWYVTIKF